MAHENISKTVRGRRGAVLIYLMVAMIAFVGFASLAIDVGHVRLVKLQLQHLADAAALYAAPGISDGTAVARAMAAAGDNTVDGRSFTLQSGDVELGNWANHVFTPAGTPTNAVRVTAQCNTARGNAVPLSFGAAIGMRSANAHASAIASMKSAAYGIVGLNSISMGGGTVYGYDSSNGAGSYLTMPDANGTIASDGNISVSGSAMIYGDAMAGPGMQVSAKPGAITGTIGQLPQPINYPAASAGAAATTNDDGNIPSSYFNASTLNLTVSGGNSLSLPAGVYYVNNLTLSGGASLNFLGPVQVYVTGSVTLSGGSVGTSAGLPDNFKLYVCSTATVTVSGSAMIFADVYAPQSDFKISGSGGLAGRIIASSITETGGSNLYYDESLSGVGGHVSLVQ